MFPSVSLVGPREGGGGRSVPVNDSDSQWVPDLQKDLTLNENPGPEKLTQSTVSPSVCSCPTLFAGYEGQSVLTPVRQWERPLEPRV